MPPTHSPIYVIAGPPAAGKSFYIKQHFPDIPVVDLFDFQKNLPVICVETAIKSWQECEAAILQEAKGNDLFVVEHTLLKAQRRIDLINKIREVTDRPLHLIFLRPNNELLSERMKQRGQTPNPFYFRNIDETTEMPTMKEGWTSVTLVINDIEHKLNDAVDEPEL